MAPRAFPAIDLPEQVVEALSGLGDCLLLGAHAREHVVHRLAGLAPGRSTTDFDLALAVPSIDRFREVTGSLRRASESGTRFVVADWPVDIIPFSGADGPLHGVIEVVPGVQIDVTGQAEAFESAERMPAPADWLRLPSLHAMIVLKTVAWGMRRESTSKDATDLAALLRCVASGVFADRCYDAPLLLRWADPELAGAHLTGIDAARDLPIATAACLEHWSTPELSAAMVARTDPTVPSFRRAQLDQLLSALVDGAEEGLRR